MPLGLEVFLEVAPGCLTAGIGRRWLTEGGSIFLGYRETACPGASPTVVSGVEDQVGSDVKFSLGRTWLVVTDLNRITWKGWTPLRAPAYLLTHLQTFSSKPRRADLDPILFLAFDPRFRDGHT